MQMFRRMIARTTLLIIALCVAGPVSATSNYKYKSAEYPLIEHGLSPDRHQSIRAHGQGDLGDEDFHLYLFREGPQKRIGALEEVVPLDTSPGSFMAAWSSDSHAVAIRFRSDRRTMDTVAYILANNRAYQITGPSLLEAATQLKLQTLSDSQTAGDASWIWQGPTRFTLRIAQTFKTDTPSLLKALGTFGQHFDNIGDGWTLEEFSAEADCELVGQNSYRILAIRPGKFD